MKKVIPLLPLAAAVLLSSCASPSEYRAKHSPELFSKLSPAEQKDVRAGVLKEGMSRDAVFLAWGAPARVTSNKMDGKTYERWQYPSVRPVRPGYGYSGTTGVDPWGGYHEVGFYDPYNKGGPALGYVRTKGWKVEFVDGRVRSFTAPG